uniref:Uncharacterized protein n=1 Tax=uncultured marine group II/III euryarchaeote KM3_54_D07 TaxID=1456460 RepID=A0A075HDT7_9EURY|nr:hypothetical protein [uncultured marine group II/III euryarchaeote KM3_54_D07]
MEFDASVYDGVTHPDLCRSFGILKDTELKFGFPRIPASTPIVSLIVLSQLSQMSTQ